MKEDKGNMTPALLLELVPDIVWQTIALFLEAPDILSFLCVNRSTRAALQLDPNFWTVLLKRYEIATDKKNTAGDSSTSNIHSSSTSSNHHQHHHSYQDARSRTLLPTLDVKDLKEQYIQKYLTDRCHSVKWYPVEQDCSAEHREGHVAFLTNDDRYICLTGGFTGDTQLHCKDIQFDGDRSIWTQQEPPWGAGVPMRYGASCTVVGNRVFFIGGFEHGGYQGESCRVSVFTVVDNVARDCRANVPTKRLCPPSDVSVHDPYLSRAYHSATLLNNRYIFILGGMQSNQSILNPAIFDTETETWITENILDTTSNCPDARHGHSAILDAKHNQIFLFGGGNGADLLRDGHDMPEVWCLYMDNYREDFMGSMPWKWGELYIDPSTTALQKLNLGRCHTAYQVSPSKVLFAFGSGRPSTNRVLVYDMDVNEFREPQVEGIIPPPRFTLASVLLPDGYIFYHGGFNANTGQTLGDAWLLDLAPELKRPVQNLKLHHGRRPFRLIIESDIPTPISVEEFLGFLRYLSPMPQSLQRMRALEFLHQSRLRGGFAGANHHFEVFLGMLSVGVGDANDILDDLVQRLNSEEDDMEIAD